MNSNVRRDEVHCDEIIELAGEDVLNCSFTRCEFVGRANCFVYCQLTDNKHLPDAALIQGCVIKVPRDGAAIVYL